MRVVVQGGKSIGLGRCIVLALASGVFTHVMFRLLGLSREVPLWGFSVSLTGLVAATITVVAIHLFSRPTAQ